MQTRRDIWMGGHEITHNGQDVERAEHRRRGNGQLASRVSVFASGLELGIGKVLKNATHGLVILLTTIGDNNLAR